VRSVGRGCRDIGCILISGTGVLVRKDDIGCAFDLLRVGRESLHYGFSIVLDFNSRIVSIILYFYPLCPLTSLHRHFSILFIVILAK